MMLRFTLIFMNMLLSTNAVFDVTAVREDIVAMLDTNTPPENDAKPHAFFIRLAWHCTGTYRTSDGRGGCEGARIMYPPEKDWGSNNKLDQGIAMLQDIKDKYGEDLSWGDLIVLTGNTAIEEMGGPMITFCQGRIDTDSMTDVNARGADHGVELDNDQIYLPGDTFNASKVRASFEIMDMNDRETVALIGGGHAFGKLHLDTGGFEGPWTTQPFVWDNEFFLNLVGPSEYWTEFTNEAGNSQWRNNQTGVAMLQTDMVLLMDDSFSELVSEYAASQANLTRDFAAAWHKLTNRDLGLRYQSMCDAKKRKIILSYDVDAVKADLKALFDDTEADFGHYGAFYIRLAWHCAGTYRSTDNKGGCVGSRIRWSPELDWGSNAALDRALEMLEPIQQNHTGLSWADLIILSGSTAIEDLGGRVMPFCGGRKDGTAEDALEESAYLNPEIYLDAQVGTVEEIKETMRIMGFTEKEMTVLNGGGHSVGKTHPDRSGFDGPWTHKPTELSNDFFKLLLSEDWVEEIVPSTSKVQYTSGGLSMLGTDLRFIEDPGFKAHVEHYAEDNDAFLNDFAAAWLKLVNADRFDVDCPTMADAPGAPPSAATPPNTSPTAMSGAAGLDILLTCIISFFTLLVN